MLTLKITEPLAARIYLTYSAGVTCWRVVAGMHGVTPAKAKELYDLAKLWIHEGDTRWMTGLSPRAKNRVKLMGYTDFETFSADVMSCAIDLEDFPRVGHKLAVEIHRWCAMKRE